MIRDEQTQKSAGLFIKAVDQHRAGNYSEAIRLYRELLTQIPDHAGACCNLGSLLRRQGDAEEGIALLRRAVAADPRHADAWHNLGNALYETGKRMEALGCYRRAVAARPLFREALRSLATALVSFEFLDEAMAVLQQITDDLQALLLLGTIYEQQGMLSKAQDCYESVLKQIPEDAGVLQCLGNVLLLRGRAEEATRLYRQAAAGNNSRLVSSLLLALQYHPLPDEATQWNQTRQLGSRFGKGAAAGSKQERAPGPLRVGYVSGDFCSHPVGLFFQEVLRNHDRNSVTPFCYSNGTPRFDAVTAALQAGSNWREIGRLDDDAVQALIAEDGIDLLVDLAGHTARNRMTLFARRAAPVQVSWLGYFATTGIPAMDYVVMDYWHVPEGGEHFFSEKVLYLPHSRLCFCPPPFAPQPAAEPPCVRNGFITFGSFNSSAKLNQPLLELWATLLEHLPSSRLILKWVTFADPLLCEEVRAPFRKRGITDDRLELRGRSSHAELLAQYADIDIALDPFPFSGGMTSCEALWMGVPVVTLPGRRPVSRQTFSFLKTIGLETLVAAEEAAYTETALLLARDQARLMELRSGLRQRMAASPLCDAQAFTRALEELWQQAWYHSCKREDVWSRAANLI